MKAIETVYKGYRFRSRLEARWAVLFDELKIKWEYEPEGFELEDGIRYLPDFYFPEYDWYGEVKPPRDGAQADIKKAIRFVDSGQIKVLLLFGNIPNEVKPEVWHFSALYYNYLQRDVVAQSVVLHAINGYGRFFAELAVDKAHFRSRYYVEKYCENVLCAEHDYSKYARCALDAKMQGAFDKESDAWANVLDKEDVALLNCAFKKARQARFEHMESPEVI